MNYVIIIKELSSGSLDRSITPYEDEDTALRKFHEAFNTIGGGPKRITSILLKDIESQSIGSLLPDENKIIKTFNAVVIKNETWVQGLEPELEPEEET